MRAEPLGQDVERLAGDGVTIAIPNWNHELFLPRSIGSALRAVEGLRRHAIAAEVLVIDDASRDGSPTLLRQLEALYYNDGLRVLALRDNVGVAGARNVALRLATRRYIAFLDADNELVETNLYHFYRSIRQTEATAVYGNVLSLSEGGAEVSVLSNESFQARIFRGNYIDTCALYDRQHLIDCGGFEANPESPMVEDWELWQHLAASGRRIVEVPLAFAMYHNLPHSRVKEFTADMDRGREKSTRIFNQSGVREKVRLNAKHLRYHPDIGWL
jgi:glycosyltransferase involved in cell wall biosynthesis